MTIGDWRRLAAPRMAALYEAEARWWRTHLGWDLTRALQDLESARLDGRLPGLTVLDGYGDPIGWTYFSGSGEVVQVGAIVAATRAGASHLVNTVVDAAEDVGATSVLALVRPGVPGVIETLSARGFEFETYHYLEARTQPAIAVPPGIRQYVEADVTALPGLLERAYAGSTERRPFAPGGTRAEWVDYVGQLLTTRGCGLFMPPASVVFTAGNADGAPGGINIDGVSIVTAISDTHAHLAQVAVDPGARSQGIGKALIEGASASARACGFSRLTLFVAGGNRRARALYDRLGFRVTTSFTAAVRVQPRLSTSVAPSAGGARTLR
jgi:ribosomal protein S18 acetylase RimI-like enzyme